MAVFQNLLNNASSLLTLKLRTELPEPWQVSVWRPKGILALAETVASSFMPSLRYADLRLPFPSRDRLIGFMKRHRNALRQLQLYRTELRFQEAPLMALVTERISLEAEVLQLELRIIEDVSQL